MPQLNGPSPQSNGSSVVIGQDELRSFSSFEIREDILNLHEFSLVCPRSALEALSSGSSQQGWNVSDKIGSPITFSVTGIETRQGKSSDFRYKGIITSIQTYRDQTNNIQEGVRITGSGSDILLADIPNCRCFEDQSIDEIVDQILMDYPQDLISKTGSHGDSTRYPYIVQYNETTLEFFHRLLGIFGEWFYYDGKNLVCGPVKRTEEKGIYGINISNIEISSSISPLNFRTKYHDFVEDTTTTGDSANVSLDSFVGKEGKNALNRSDNLYPQNREAFLPFINSLNIQPDIIDKEISVQKKVFATALVSITGTSLAPFHVGNVLNIFPHHKNNLDPSTVDMGNYLITKVVHHFTNHEKSYYNTFEGIPSEMDILPRREEIKRPYCPVQNAVITDNDDPDSLGRVKVHFDWMEDGQSTPWIRTVNPHSGDGRGFYFVPETGDEVVVGFEQNHPQKPYVIGTMYGGNHAPDQGWVTSQNNIKMIRTRQGNTIEFDDTSGSEQLIIFNGDGSSANSNNNKILLTLNPDKITIESDGDIEIKGINLNLHADADISIQSDGGAISLKGSQVTIQADGGSIGLNGQQVSIQADEEFKAEGASAEIDGSGQVTIKGGVVQIN
jgi:type VI secretion system secreted protein VgrG